MRRVRLLNVILWMALVLTIFSGIFDLAFGTNPWRTLWFSLVLLLIEGIALLLMWQGYLDWAALFFVGMVWVVYSGLILITGGIYSPDVYGQMLVVLGAGLLLGWQAAGVFAVASIFWVVAVSYAGLWGFLDFSSVLDNTFGSRLVSYITQLVAVSVLLGLADQSIKNALKQASENAQKSNSIQAQLEATLDALPDMMFEVGPRGRILDYRAPKNSGINLAPESFLYKRFSEVLPEDASAVIADALNEASASGRSRGATYSMDVNGETRWFELSVSVKGTADGNLIALVREVTHRIESERRLKGDLKETAALARTDDLTGLLNRRAILEMAEAEFDRAQRQKKSVSLLLIDMFRLKEINDTHGHLTGDAALKLLAQVLRENRRRYDWVGRWGGDEFVVVLPGVGDEKALQMAERLLEQVQDTYVSLPDGGQERLRVSVGVSCFEEDEHENVTLETLLTQADKAMYQAKETGPNTAGVYQVKK